MTLRESRLKLCSVSFTASSKVGTGWAGEAGQAGSGHSSHPRKRRLQPLLFSLPLLRHGLLVAHRLALLRAITLQTIEESRAETRAFKGGGRVTSSHQGWLSTQRIGQSGVESVCYRFLLCELGLEVLQRLNRACARVAPANPLIFVVFAAPVSITTCVHVHARMLELAEGRHGQTHVHVKRESRTCRSLLSGRRSACLRCKSPCQTRMGGGSLLAAPPCASACSCAQNICMCT